MTRGPTNTSGPGTHSKPTKLLSFIISAILFSWACPTRAEIHQTWVAKYTNVSTGTNRAVALALDPAGNIILCGTSQNANTNLDYVTLKYQPNGNQLWTARYDSTNANDIPRGLIIDTAARPIVTGTSATVKYDTNGQQLWTAPYGGRALMADTNQNIYVTGCSNDVFATVKLSPAGSNLWLRTFSSVAGAHEYTQVVAPDPAGNITVCGHMFAGVSRLGVDYKIGSFQYDPDGTLLSQSEASGQCGSAPVFSPDVKALGFDTSGAMYVANNGDYGCGFVVNRFTNNAVAWTYTPTTSAFAALLSSLQICHLKDAIVIAGGAPSANSTNGMMLMRTTKLDTNAHELWFNEYGNALYGEALAQGLILDSNDNVYVTGFVPSAATGNDIVTIKYDKDGNQQWVQTYDGPAHGDDRGVAIAVNKVGDVYVAGYETLPGGGTQIVLIKYSVTNIQPRPDGSVHLEYAGVPNQSYTFKATTDFSNWFDLGSSIADTNNIATFDDTNAPAFPARFYRTFGP